MFPDEYCDAGGVCITPFYENDGTSIRIYHPLKDDPTLGQYFNQFYFDVQLIVNTSSSVSPQTTFDEIPTDMLLGDYEWGLTRSGVVYIVPDNPSGGRWTNNQNPSADIRAVFYKADVTKTIEDITPTWDEVLNLFGGLWKDTKSVAPNIDL